MRRVLILMGVVLFVSGFAFAGGAGEATPQQEGGAGEPAIELEDVNRDDGVLRIVGTTTQAFDLLEILTEGTDGVEVTGLMGAGVDPHLYQPTERDIQVMNQADVVVYNGLNLEGQYDAVFEALREQGVVVYGMYEPVQNAGFIIGAFEIEEEVEGADDPHFWFDPRNWGITVQDTARLLGELDPAQASVYNANAEAYVQQLDLLYDWADRGMRSIPGRQRYLVTSHDAFQYFGAAFGWRMAAIQGISTEDEAGVGDVQETVDFVITNEIPVLFVESTIPPDTIQAVIEAIEAEGGAARIGVRELYSDAMGSRGTFGGTYIGMIAENVYTVLQSYRAAGVDVEIPAWPAGLNPTPPASILNATE
ncbi:MAG: zinc ABC transporter substrate-binding protein [Spirochaetales bacterium]|nr:zinc ABC transporter substrate-binding protein [Spirochaetales bacterium]